MRTPPNEPPAAVSPKLTAATAATAASVLSSTISGHVLPEADELEPVPGTNASKYVQAYDATAFQEAFGSSARGKGGEGADKPLLAKYEVSGDTRRPPPPAKHSTEFDPAPGVGGGRRQRRPPPDRDRPPRPARPGAPPHLAGPGGSAGVLCRPDASHDALVRPARRGEARARRVGPRCASPRAARQASPPHPPAGG